MNDVIQTENTIIECALIMTAIERAMRSPKEQQSPYMHSLLVNQAAVVSAFSEDSPSRLLASSQKLYGTVLDFDLEESSRRYVITFKASNADNPETVRTLRIDSPGCDYLKDYVPRLVGKRCVIYKAKQTMGDSASGKGRTVRIAPCIIPLGSKER
jgi:hypothetical protein